MTDLSDGIVWRTEKRKISDLLEWEKNPRILTEKQAADLGESLRRFGYVEPVVVNADGKSIIGGHQRRRVLVAQAMLDPNATIDVRLPSRMLTEDEREELAIRLNRNVGEWDYERLANEFDLHKLVEWGFDPQEFSVDPAVVSHAAPAPEEDLGERTIELVLDNETREEFKALIVKLSARYGTYNITDTVLTAMRREAENRA